MPHAPGTTSIKHRALNPHRKNPFSVATLFGEFSIIDIVNHLFWGTPISGTSHVLHIYSDFSWFFYPRSPAMLQAAWAIRLGFTPVASFCGCPMHLRPAAPQGFYSMNAMKTGTLENQSREYELWDVRSLWALKLLFACGFHIGFAWGNTRSKHIWRLDFGEFCGEYSHLHSKLWSFASYFYIQGHRSQRWSFIDYREQSKTLSKYIVYDADDPPTCQTDWGRLTASLCNLRKFHK